MADSPFLNKFFLLTSLVLLRALPLQAAPLTDLYEITSGTYTEIGGIAGVLTFDLPTSFQAFIELTIDHELNSAEMQILGNNLDEPFGFIGFGSPFIDGNVNGNLILFDDATLVSEFGASGELAYSIVLNGDLISLQGELSSEPLCCDIPYRFYHTGVEASLVPAEGGDEIPTVSEWGLIVMTLLTLAVGSVVVMRRTRRPEA